MGSGKDGSAGWGEIDSVQPRTSLIGSEDNILTDSGGAGEDKPGASRWDCTIR